MAIAEQFSGLPMDQLIGAPLRAAADASTLLANSTADFIQRVGFDGEGKVRTVAFGYQKRSMNEDGTSNLDEMKVDVPMLAIVPIPNLQVDEVNILFDMEVKQSEKQESSMDMGATITGTVNLGIVKVSVTGNVSAHQSNTRSSDNSAKYHVDVRATNHGVPEGMAKVLDMIAANVAPMLVGSSLKDGNGQSLSEQARVKSERLKTLRQEIKQIEERLSAARDGLDTSLAQFKKVASAQLNVYQSRMNGLMNNVEEDLEKKIAAEKDEEKKKELIASKKIADAYPKTMDEINQCWNALQNQVKDFVKMIDDSNASTEAVSDMFALKALSEEGVPITYKDGEDYYTALAAAQKSAVDCQHKASLIETELFNKKAEYSDAIAGKTPAALEG